jgi:dihydroxyacetone kinase-like predicted kinase
MRYLFKNDLDAAHVISGGQTMNPSAEDFLEAIQALSNTEIILLTNNKNIIMAAEQAATMAEGKSVRVVPTKTVPQGISAMLAYKNAGENASLDEIAEAMTEAIPLVTTAEVTFATRSVELDGVIALEGQPIGLLEGKMVASGQKLEDVVIEVLEKAQTRQRDLVTLYYGSIVRSQDAESLVARLSEMFSNQEFQIVFGGQPLYPYLISVE